MTEIILILKYKTKYLTILLLFFRLNLWPEEHDTLNIICLIQDSFKQVRDIWLQTVSSILKLDLGRDENHVICNVLVCCVHSLSETRTPAAGWQNTRAPYY